MGRLAPLLLFLSAPAFAQAPAAAPPVASRFPETATVHGATRRDDYAWLRDKKDPAVLAYLEAENRYTDAVMAPTAALQEKLYQEMLGRIVETDVDVPYRLRGHWYYSRTEKGKQYKIHARKQGTLEAPETITVDLNRLAEGHKFMSLGAYEVADDDKLLAYSTDDTGFREYALRLRDLTTGQDLADRVPKVRSVAWAAESRTLYYTVETADSKRSYRLYRHVVGQPVAEDELVYEESDARFDIYVDRTRSGRWLVMRSGSHTQTEWRVTPADKPGEWKVVLPRAKDLEYELDHGGSQFVLTINDKGRNNRVVAVPEDDPRLEVARELVPHRDDVMIDRVALFAGFAVRLERADATPRLVISDGATGDGHVVDLPEPVRTVVLGSNAEFDTPTVRLIYTSLVTPLTVFDYDLKARRLKLMKQIEVRGGYDPARYVTRRLHAKAPDGTAIPISIVYRRDVKRDGRAPLLLEAYGSYGAPYDVAFSSNDLSFLERGVVLATAHIRGGGDLGKKWHDDGRMAKKMNTFTDFIACADHLVRERWTSPRGLVIQGGSAGGLLMGTVANLRPELWKAVVAHVPFVDVINTMLDGSLPLTVAEFEEWGNPEVKADYDTMKAYSPYDNVAAKKYPAMLVKTSWNDSQVMYWEPAKWVAKLRAMKKDRNVLILRTNMAGGHGGSSGRYDKLREVAFDVAFILGQMGITR